MKRRAPAFRSRVCARLLPAAVLWIACSSSGTAGDATAGGAGTEPEGGLDATMRDRSEDATTGERTDAASGGTGSASSGTEPLDGDRPETSPPDGASRDAGRSSTGTTGATTSTGGGGTTSGTGGATPCKRGIAANVAPGSAFFPAIGWWYNWSNKSTGASTGIEFVPMIWDEQTVNTTPPAGSRYLLGFNEPNFKVQANLTAAQAASYWSSVEASARAAGIPIVSPAVNFCGPATDCNGTDPYAYLKDFFVACAGCKVDYVAVHWYNCDVPSLKDYLEPGGSLEGFEQFGKPIWVTEFACSIGGDASAAGQETYMRQAIPYLEGNPHVFRYSWFSADPIPGAKLINDDGSPTALGRVYMSLPGACQ